MKGTMQLMIWRVFAYALAFAILPICVSAQTSNPAPVSPVANPCPRSREGSVVTAPHAFFGHDGVLRVNFSYQKRVDPDGRILFCFMTPEGYENPTLHIHPGDHLIIDVTNNTPSSPVEMAMPWPHCGDSVMTGSSLNIHYHGTNVSPTCGQDDVIHTAISSGQTFQYNVAFPSDEPPGLYWYHPHVHGLLEAALQGGASGAIVVDGIQDLQPAVAGLRQRVLVIRDQNVAGNPAPGGAHNVPSWDLTLNDIPVPYPDYPPAVIQMGSGEKQLWRVMNASADSLVDLQVVFDGVPQTLQIVGLDGVPTGSQDGARRGRVIDANHVLVPTAGRAEFIVAAPPSNVKLAQFVTLNVTTGPNGDNDPARPLATIRTLALDENQYDVDDNERRVPRSVGPAWRQRFEEPVEDHGIAKRTLYFSEVLSDPNNPLSPTNFFITVDGAAPVLFSPENPPAIVTTQGTVEDWTIQNRTLENHEFHMHQIHFLVLSQNHFEINGTPPIQAVQGQFLDTIQVPYWDGNANHPFPEVTLRMDFRGSDVGDFVYHCHIAGHEDGGMMAIIRVLPRSPEKAGQETPIP